MNIFRCNVCNVFEYDQSVGQSSKNIRPNTLPEDFPDQWRCPICGSDKTHLKPYEKVPDSFEKNEDEKGTDKLEKESYLGEWKRHNDPTEQYMDDIHKMAITGKSIIEPMRTTKKVISWDDILIRAVQLGKFPLNDDVEVSTKTVIGSKAKIPIVIDTPIFITHMSFGELSKELKTVLAKGSAKVKTAMGSGEGGILEETITTAYKYIFEYVTNRYSVTDKNLKRVDAVEIKIGQSAKPGEGGTLPGKKVTEEVSKIRGYPAGVDIKSPATFDDIRSKDDLRDKVTWLKEKTGGKPVGIKFAAGHVEADLEVAIYADPDFITIDGRPGATGGATKFIKDATSVPTLFALARARKYLDENGAGDITLVITGGFRRSSDVAKALALGADAVAIGTAALMACACQQYRLCDTGKCPVGVTTQDPRLRSRLDIETSAIRLANYLRLSTEELKAFARLTGNDNVHDLSVDDLVTTNSEISMHTPIKHA